MKRTIALCYLLSLTVAAPAYAAFFSKNGWVATAATKKGQAGVICQNLQASGQAKKPVFITSRTESWARSLDAQTFQVTMKTKKGVPVQVVVYPSCDGTWWNKQTKRTDEGYKVTQKSLNLPTSVSRTEVTTYLNRQGVR